LRGILTPSAQLILSIRQEFINRTTSWFVLVQNAQIAIDSVDVVLFVVDGSVEAGRSLVLICSAALNPGRFGLNKIDQKPRIFNMWTVVIPSWLHISGRW